MEIFIGILFVIVVIVFCIYLFGNKHQMLQYEIKCDDLEERLEVAEAQIKELQETIGNPAVDYNTASQSL